MSEEKEKQLISLHGQLSAALLQHGLAFARTDDPHAYGAAAKLMRAPGSRFELRIVIAPDDPRVCTRGLIVDEHGEALVQLFEVTATAPQAH